MLSVGPWTHVLPKPCETMFNMPENLRFLWGVHDEKRARPGTRKEQQGTHFFSLLLIEFNLQKLIPRVLKFIFDMHTKLLHISYSFYHQS